MASRCRLTCGFVYLEECFICLCRKLQLGIWVYNIQSKSTPQSQFLAFALDETPLASSSGRVHNCTLNSGCTSGLQKAVSTYMFIHLTYILTKQFLSFVFRMSIVLDSTMCVVYSVSYIYGAYRTCGSRNGSARQGKQKRGIS